MFLHRKNCPLKPAEDQRVSDCITDGLLLIQTYLPPSDKLDEVIHGMRDSKMCKGILSLDPFGASIYQLYVTMISW